MTKSSIQAAGVAALCAGLLGGCVVGPRFTPPKAETPAGWTAVPAAAPAPGASLVTTAEASDQAWWNSFGDPELTSLIERAAQSNFDARQAVLRIEEARGQRRLAAAGAWPQVNAAGSYENVRISERTATTSLLSSLGEKSQSGAPGGVASALSGLSNPFDQYEYGLSASWELDLFGRVRRTVEAADADTAAAVEDARAVRVSLMAEVAAAYVDLRAVQARRAVTAEALETAKGLLRLAEDSRRAGLGGDLDIANARAEVATAEAALPPLDQQVSADKNQLALLLAANPGALDAELDAAKALPPVPPQVPVGLPSDLARRRPDIRRAEARLHAAVARQGVAVANLYPSISLNAGAGFEASKMANLTNWAARYMTIGPSLDLPVFDAGQRRATVKIQDVRAKEAALTYAQAVLAALHEVDDAITAYDLEQSRRTSLETAVAENRTALALAQRRYQTGSVSFRDVLDAEDKLQQAQLALTASAAATDEDLVGLYKALGGGWQAGPPA
ncbi:MAG: efflux transporter outer membrane subunit [Caulobacteraceae bacterium]|nr:efflux transporter outer membrane subunit [Caulobacteraceae bacterium]